MDNDVKAAFDAGNNFQQKLNDTLLGLISANNDRKSEIANLDNFAKSENDARIKDISDINSRMEKENSERNAEDKALNDRIDKEIRDRQDASPASSQG